MQGYSRLVMSTFRKMLSQDTAVSFHEERAAVLQVCAGKPTTELWARLPFVGFAQGRVSILLHFFCNLMVEWCDHRANVNNHQIGRLTRWIGGKQAGPSFLRGQAWSSLFQCQLMSWSIEQAHCEALLHCIILCYMDADSSLMKQLLAEPSLCFSVAKLSLHQMKQTKWSV